MTGVVGVSHVTLSVADLDRSIRFYRDVLGCRLRARWYSAAYLEAGDLWLCLFADPNVQKSARSDYSHIAFSASSDTFDSLSDRIKAAARLWKDHVGEGASTYFLDPDDHKLELHLGDLPSRLAHFQRFPRPDQVLYS